MAGVLDLLQRRASSPAALDDGETPLDKARRPFGSLVTPIPGHVMDSDASDPEEANSPEKDDEELALGLDNGAQHTFGTCEYIMT